MPDSDSLLAKVAATSQRSPSLIGMTALYVLLLALVVTLHLASGSERSELGSHPDEAAHFVTGLMVRDYVASGFHESPLRYADDYYRHYPKIGLGIWPPFFYLVQAAWTLIFPGGAATVLHLISALGMALALVTGWWLWREYGWAEAVAGAVILTALPLVQQYSNMVMAEVLSALLMFGATGYFARYMEGAEWRGAIGFGICAGLAIMTKGTGLALAFVPMFAILFTGRYDLLKKKPLWVAALLVVAIAGPWTWHFRNQGRGGWEEPNPSFHFAKSAITYYGWQMGVALGGMLAALALAGAASLFRPKGRKPAIAICSLALALGVWIFQCLAPVGLEARHLTPAMPALIVLAMTGSCAISERCCARFRPPCPIVTGGLLALFFLWPGNLHPPTPFPGYGSLGNRMSVSPFRIPRKEWHGFEQITDAALAVSPGAPLLVASDARGEGMFIAEVASRDAHRPSYTVERASKLLAASTWSGGGYQQFYHTPEQVLAALAHAGIKTVVIDSSPPNTPEHQRLLADALGSPGSGFGPALSAAAVRDGRETPGGITLMTPVPGRK